MYKIGYRTIKTALATTFAVSISKALALNYFTSSGIISILCVQNTKKKSMQSAFSRFAACNLSMLLAGAWFTVLGFETWVIGLHLLFFIPLTVVLRIQEGIVTSSVIMFHIFLSEKISVALFWNEFQIIVVGIGMALLANLYMPSKEEHLNELREEIETDFKLAFLHIAANLKHREYKVGEVLDDLGKKIKSAKSTAFLEVENHLTRNEDYFYHYFTMREKQLSYLKRMESLSQTIEHSEVFCEEIASFLSMLGLSVHSGNTAARFLDELEEMRDRIRHMDLPTEREEFEERARLYGLLQELEDYLHVKSQLQERDENGDASFVQRLQKFVATKRKGTK